jgi:hypothetical protein
MQDKTLRYDPKNQRATHDFTALADLLHSLMDWNNPCCTANELRHNHEMDYTTEWQMVAAVEADGSE